MDRPHIGSNIWNGGFHRRSVMIKGLTWSPYDRCGTLLFNRQFLSHKSRTAEEASQEFMYLYL